MIFVAFLVPLALYLLLIGWINRQPRPLLVSGTLDFIGILFAASGFLLVGGPAVLSSLNERWRMFWILGEGGRALWMFGESSGISEGLDGARQLWVFLAALYFFVVIVICGWVLWGRRATTAIYNVEPAVAESAIIEACGHLGLTPIRSGNLFVFGLTLDPSHEPPAGIQAPHVLPRSDHAIKPESSLAEELGGENAILEVEPFPAMKHVTLRWDPYDSPVRPALEAELARRLSRLGAPYHDTGAWLGLIGSGLLALSMLIVFALMLRTLLLR